MIKALTKLLMTFMTFAIFCSCFLSEDVWTKGKQYKAMRYPVLSAALKNICSLLTGYYAIPAHCLRVNIKRFIVKTNSS